MANSKLSFAPKQNIPITNSGSNPLPFPLSLKVNNPTSEETTTKKKPRLYPCSNLKHPTQNPFAPNDDKIPLVTNPTTNNRSYAKQIEVYVKTLEEIQKLGLDVLESKAKFIQKHMHHTLEKSLEKDRQIDACAKKNQSWDKAANIIGGIGGTTSICIGVNLLTAGAALPVIAGIGLIFSGLTSISGAIFEMAGVNNNVTNGVQIAGGVISLVAGCATFATNASKLPLAVKIGSGLLATAAYSANGVSSLYKKQSFEHLALSDKLESSLTIDRDELNSTKQLLEHISQNYLDNTVNLIGILKREEEILRKMVEIQLLRG